MNGAAEGRDASADSAAALSGHLADRFADNIARTRAGVNHSDSWISPTFATFEELVDASGVLEDRPPVPTGESGHPFYTVQPMQLLSWYPRAYIFPKFMDKARCDHVIKLAERRLAPSGLALKKGDTLASTREIRTSQGTFMSRVEDPDGVLAWIEDKIGENVV